MWNVSSTQDLRSVFACTFATGPGRVPRLLLLQERDLRDSLRPILYMYVVRIVGTCGLLGEDVIRDLSHDPTHVIPSNLARREDDAPSGTNRTPRRNTFGRVWSLQQQTSCPPPLRLHFRATVRHPTIRSPLLHAHSVLAFRVLFYAPALFCDTLDFHGRELQAHAHVPHDCSSSKLYRKKLMPTCARSRCLDYHGTQVRLASKRFLAGSLGVAAGVMLYVSLVEIFVKSQDAFANHGFSEVRCCCCACCCACCSACCCCRAGSPSPMISVWSLFISSLKSL